MRMFEKWRLLKNHILKLFFLSVPILVCSVLICSGVCAAESGKNLVPDLASILHLEVNKQPGQTENGVLTSGQNSSPKFLPSSQHVQLPLNDSLKLFYDLQRMTKDRYDRPDYRKSCATFGIDISF